MSGLTPQTKFYIIGVVIMIIGFLPMIISTIKEPKWDCTENSKLMADWYLECTRSTKDWDDFCNKNIKQMFCKPVVNN